MRQTSRMVTLVDGVEMEVATGIRPRGSDPQKRKRKRCYPQQSCESHGWEHFLAGKRSVD